MNKVIFIVIVLCTVYSQVSGQNNGQPHQCTGRPIGSFQTDVTACNAYFFCSPNGSAQRGFCPSPFMFNQPQQTCDWVENVNCFECPPFSHVHNLPVEGSCTQFIRCINRVPSFQTCPSGLYFDRALETCNLAHLANCTIPTGPVCPPNVDPNNPTMIRDDANCNRYIICLPGGNSETRNCAPNLHFNPAINQCDLPENSDCPSGGGNGGGGGNGENPGGNTFNCAAQDPSISPPIFPHPTQCSRYVICASGVAHFFDCPTGTMFDNLTRQCTLQGQGTCAPGAVQRRVEEQ